MVKRYLTCKHHCDLSSPLETLINRGKLIRILMNDYREISALNRRLTVVKMY